ncbi:MAG TPA: MnhB domain-containing protein [Vicinamibacterales bacterium]|jgi:multicomponent Na+:H+ antiporter subunit B
MRAQLRTWLFVPAAVALAALFWWAYRLLPPVGAYNAAYGNYIARASVPERHATDTVNAVTYDYRGIDTLGEEFILFGSVIGVLLLFRKQPDQEPAGGQRAESDDDVPASDTMRVTMQAIVAAMVVFGIYEATHGQLTPGGGFQGGVILASAPLLVYLAGHVRTFERTVSHPVLEIAEAVGASAYALIGASALLVGAGFLTNWVPLGETHTLLSAGTIEWISLAVGLEVSGSFVLIMYSYLQEIIEGRGGD